jgi:hypothetical protein
VVEHRDGKHDVEALVGERQRQDIYRVIDTFHGEISRFVSAGSAEHDAEPPR